MRGRAAALLLLLAAGCSSYEPAPWNEADLLRELRDVRIEFPADGLDAERAAAIALVHNPGLRTLRRGHEIAEHAVVAEGAWQNPEFRIGLQDLLSTGGNPLSLALGLRFFPSVPGEHDARIARAQARKKRVLAEVEDREVRVAVETRIVHARVVLLEETLQILRAAGQAHDRVLTVVSRRVAGQASTKLDEAFAILKREQIADDLETLSGQLDAARAELAALLGASPATPIAVKKAAETPPPELAQEKLEEDALKGRPDLRALKEEYEAREQDLRLAHLAHAFWPTFLQPGHEGDRRGRGGTVQAAFEIPVFDSGGADIAVEEARRRQARDAYAARLHAVRHEIHLAALKFREEERRRRRLTERLDPVLRQTEELIGALLEAGEADALKLVTIETRLLEARREAARSRFEVERARIQLAQAAGAIFRKP